MTSLSRKSAFSRFHPLSTAVYLLSQIVFAMFAENPFLIALSLAGALCFLISLVGVRALLSSLKALVPLFVAVVITNPLFNHNGVTPLFFVNNNPFTVEALLYGAYLGAMLFAALLWCKCFSEIMGTDKLLYLLGGSFPKPALALCGALRLLPLFSVKWRQIKMSRKALGCYASRGLAYALRDTLRTLSCLLTYSLENSVETALSMTSRGYGLKKHSRLALYRFTHRDSLFLAYCVICVGMVVVGLAFGCVGFSFYPRISLARVDVLSSLVYAGFCLYSLTPLFVEVKEAVLWKYLKSKI